MAWPASSVSVGDVITAAQLNLLPIQIADSTAATAVASFDFTSLPGQFAHLMVVAYCRSDHAVAIDDISLRFNNDSGSNYYWQYLQGVGTTASAGEGIGVTSSRCGLVAGSSAPAGSFASSTILIPHYTSTTEKSYVAQSSCLAAASTGNMYARSLGGLWTGSAVTRITLIPPSGNFVAGSRVTIYGLA